MTADKPHISYVDPSMMKDPAMLAELERCRTYGTPRPESQAIRAHVPAVFWSFANSWRDVFKTGVADHMQKDGLDRLGFYNMESAIYLTIQPHDQVELFFALNHLGRHIAADRSLNQAVDVRHIQPITRDFGAIDIDRQTRLAQFAN